MYLLIFPPVNGSELASSGSNRFANDSELAYGSELASDGFEQAPTALSWLLTDLNEAELAPNGSELSLNEPGLTPEGCGMAPTAAKWLPRVSNESQLAPNFPELVPNRSGGGS